MMMRDEGLGWSIFGQSNRQVDKHYRDIYHQIVAADKAGDKKLSVRLNLDLIDVELDILKRARNYSSMLKSVVGFDPFPNYTAIKKAKGETTPALVGHQAAVGVVKGVGAVAFLGGAALLFLFFRRK